jgi:hypothetical protein
MHSGLSGTAVKNFWLALVVLICFFSFVAPHSACAQANFENGAAVAPHVDTKRCQTGNSLMNAYQNNNQLRQQQLSALVHNISTLFPIAPALNACVQNIMNAFKLLPGLGNPIAFAASMVTNLLTGIINQVCSQIMGVITQAQTALTNMTKICLPLPKFNLKLDLPTFSAPSCSGGTSFSPITTSSGSSPTQGYSVSKFLQ